MEAICMNTGNSKKNEPHKFAPKLSQRLDLRGLFIYYTLKHIYIWTGLITH